MSGARAPETCCSTGATPQRDVLYPQRPVLPARDPDQTRSRGLVGELGLLAPGQRRTQTLECIEDSGFLAISYDRLKQLFIQNPQFGSFSFG